MSGFEKRPDVGPQIESGDLRKSVPSSLEVPDVRTFPERRKERSGRRRR